jgi:aminoglycoside phosphotransferase (APT) family kinase protein
MTTVAVSDLDTVAIATHLDRVRPGLRAGEITARPLAGGMSNLTFALDDGQHAWVLRRPPLGHILPSAHQMGREFRVLSALRDSSVPVPETVLLCSDTAVIGAEFLIMERVEGTVYALPDELVALGPAATRALAESTVDTLADLHLIEPDAVGLGDFGRPVGYLDRQLARWTRQVELSRSRDLPGFDELAARLGRSTPRTTRSTIVHGDYRLGNMLARRAEIAAVIDWELSTLGDPLADLGLYVTYRERPHLGDDQMANPAQAPGFPSTEDLVERYVARTGFDLDLLAWYVAFGHFKVAASLEAIHFRYTRGLTSGPGFDLVGAEVLRLVDRGLAWLTR